MVSKIKVDEIESSQAGGDITFNTLPKIGGVSNFGRKNYLINGNFDIWQRGTSGTGGYCSADRWRFDLSGATGTFAQGSFTAGQTDVPNNPKFYGDITITGADDNARIEQKIEDVNTLAGETITISFWAKYTSNAPTSFNVQINQNFGSGGSTSVNFTFDTGQTLTTSWQKFTFTGTVPSISGKTVGSGSHLIIRPIINPNNETFDYQIAQVQVEKGSVATDFEVRPIGEELSLCRRYFHKFQASAGNYVTPQIGFCTGGGDGKGYADIFYSEEPMIGLRATPTVTIEGTQASGNWRIFRLYDNATNDTQTLQSASVGFTEMGSSTGARLRVTYRWGTSSSAGNFTNQAHYRINSITGSPQISILMDSEL